MLINRNLRPKITYWANWGIAHEPQIHYTETAQRSAWLTAKPANKLPLSTDCSGFATFCYYQAGCPDPNGLNYAHLGFTGTLMGHGQKISRAQVLPGDLVIWGAYPGVHVAVCMDAGAKTLCSHGQESGPSKISFDAENAYHAAHGHQASFWRFPTNSKEVKAHVPAGFVQHPPVVVKPKAAAKPKPKAKPAPRKFYSYKRQVPLKKGQKVGYIAGKGYYAR